MSIPENGDHPVGVSDTVPVVRTRGSVLSRVVLRAADDVVERLVVVHGDFIELGHGQVRNELPVRAQVPALVQSAVATSQQVVGVVRVEHQRMVVDVLVQLTHFSKSFATVFGDLHTDVHVIDAIEFVRARENFLVVMRTRASGGVVALLLP